MMNFGDRKMSAAEIRRKTNKPIMEKKRRERINNCLEELKTMVLHAINEESRPNKLEKADILEMTVRYLRSIQPLIKAQQSNKQGKLNQTMPTNLNAFPAVDAGRVMRPHRPMAAQRRLQCSPYSTQNQNIKFKQDDGAKNLLQSSLLMNENTSQNHSVSRTICESNQMHWQSRYMTAGFATPPVSPPFVNSSLHKRPTFPVSPISSDESSGYCSKSPSGSDTSDSSHSTPSSVSWSSAFSNSNISKNFQEAICSNDKFIWRPWGIPA